MTMLDLAPQRKLLKVREKRIHHRLIHIANLHNGCV
jgi:hypothetical protein